MRLGNGDVPRRGVDPDHVGAHPRQSLAENPSAAPDVQETETREGTMGRAGGVVGGGSALASSEMANEDVADELASHGVHGVERGERAALLVPPERGVGLELGRLPGVHGIDPGVALALARASVGEVARSRPRVVVALEPDRARNAEDAARRADMSGRSQAGGKTKSEGECAVVESTRPRCRARRWRGEIRNRPARLLYPQRALGACAPASPAPATRIDNIFRVRSSLKSSTNKTVFDDYTSI